MNILYLTDADITVNKGGVNRVTHFLSRKFMDLPGWNCYLAYLYESTVLPVSEFDGKLHIHPHKAKEQVKEFICNHQITRIIVNLTAKQNIYFILPVIYSLKTGTYSTPSQLRILFCYHSYPGFELLGISPNIGFRHLIRHSNRINTLKAILQHFLNKTPLASFSRKYISGKYRFIHNHCDQVVLLSSHYIPHFAKLANLNGPHHLTCIPNPLSLPEIFSPEHLSQKQKEVLIVARLSEPIKRLSLALKIWSIIEKEESYDDWTLTILGNGEDEQYYKKLSRKLGLKHISFEGRKEPLEYYRRASIFMMTSLCEGWGLTLLEAQQMGVVPIAFNTYEALQDIIQNQYNGILIPDRNIQEYASQLKILMTNSSTRQCLAVNAINSCRQYDIDHIVQKWKELFQQ